MTELPGRTIRILVVEPLVLFRRGLAELIRGAVPGSETAEAASLDEVLATSETSRADLVIADLDDPATGLAGLNRLLAAWPEVKVTLLIGRGGRDAAFAWLQAGAHGCVPKTVTLEELCDALGTILAGNGYVSSSLLTPNVAPEPVRGTARRREDVLQLAAEGQTTMEIARHLGLSASTVKAHLSALSHTSALRCPMEAVLLGHGG